MSEQAAPHVYAAIAAVMDEVSKSGISKDRRNQQQGYAFRGIDDVYNALAPMLAKHKLVILPRMLSRTQTERETQKGGVLYDVVVDAEFYFVSAVDGSKAEPPVRMIGEGMDSADKATNKAMSAAQKYAAFQTFWIPTEGDNDADATTPEPTRPRAQEPTVPAGYEDWITDMNAKADEGLPALEAAFKASKLNLRRHATSIDQVRWNRVKAKAQAAKGAAA